MVIKKSKLFCCLLFVLCLSLTACKTTGGKHKVFADGSSYYSESGSGQYGSDYGRFSPHIKEKIYFDVDQDNLDDECMRVVQNHAEWLNGEGRNEHIIVEGHADDRGPREYNLALGDRRAHNVKRALESYGVDGHRMKIISYGKERPDVIGSDQQTWAANRRSELKLDDRN